MSTWKIVYMIYIIFSFKFKKLLLLLPYYSYINVIILLWFDFPKTTKKLKND
jgi:hypothetical protein